MFVLCIVVDYLLYVFLELFFPRKNIDICRDWPKKVRTHEEADSKMHRESDGAVRVVKGTDTLVSTGLRSSSSSPDKDLP